MFLIGASNLPMAMYTPLVLLLAAYAVLTLLAGRARSKEDTGGTERFETWSFVVLLVSALYTIVLVISAIFAYPSRSTDLVTILLVVCGFFAVLLFVFFMLAEVLPRAIRRGRTER